MEKPWNFVILFSAREGSSAIIEMLGKQEGVNVPIFEHLDLHYFPKHHRVEEITQIAEETISTGVYPRNTDTEKKTPPRKASAHRLVTGFKWRIWGERRKLADIFIRHRVKLFVLSRRDFYELVSSRYITRFGNSLQRQIDIPKHPQFMLARMKEDERQEYLEEYNRLTFPLRFFKFSGAAGSVASSKARQYRLARYFSKKGIPVREIFYEDFVADNGKFIDDFLSEIGLYPEKIAVETRFEKVSKRSAKSRVRHLRGFRYVYPLPALHGVYLLSLSAISRLSRKS